MKSFREFTDDKEMTYNVFHPKRMESINVKAKSSKEAIEKATKINKIYRHPMVSADPSWTKE